MSCAVSGVGEGLHHRGHAGGALAVLEEFELVRDVALRHAGQARVLRIGRIAVQAVAGRAGAGLLGAALLVAPHRLGLDQRLGLHLGIRRDRGDGGLGEGDGGDRKSGGETGVAEDACVAHAKLRNCWVRRLWAPGGRGPVFGREGAGLSTGGH